MFKKISFSVLLSAAYVAINLFAQFFLVFALSVSSAVLIWAGRVSAGGAISAAAGDIGLVVTLSSVFSFLIYNEILKARGRAWGEVLSLAPPSGADIAGALFTAFGLSVCVSVILGLPALKPHIKEYQEYMTGFGRGNPLFLLIGICLIAPILEEVLFRGLIFGELKKTMPMSLAIAAQAVFFGFSHGNLLQSAYAAAAGVIFAWAYEKTGTFFVPVIMHIFFNLANIANPFLAKISPIWAAVMGAFCLAIGLAALGRNKSL